MKKILTYLNEQRGCDFSGNRPSMLQRRITKRFVPTKTKDFDGYFKYLLDHPQELDNLIDTLTINVSSFFRDPLVFNHLENIISSMIDEKVKKNDHSLRVWSAGCASGEEPYSVAIIIHKLLLKENADIDVNIFATDIDDKSLNLARRGKYKPDAITDVRYGVLNDYFHFENESFLIDESIQKMVNFSTFDLLDKHRFVPPESVFGGFDMVLCRNVLIYFNSEYQDKIFDKLVRALNANGYLILGEVEVPTNRQKNKFRRFDSCCKIYQKR